MFASVLIKRTKYTTYRYLTWKSKYKVSWFRVGYLCKGLRRVKKIKYYGGKMLWSLGN